MKNAKINYVEYEMKDGECVAMSTAPVLLLKLRGTDKNVYQRLSKAMLKGTGEDDVLGMYQLLYDTYICANMDEETISYREFIENANESFQYNAEKLGELLSPRKKQDSEQLSEMQQGEESQDK